MTFTVDMTMLAILALVAGIAAFFAPRFLGIVAGIALIGFAAYQLYPEVRDWQIAEAIQDIDIGDIHWNNNAAEPASRTN